MRAVWNGQVVAESDDTVVVEGNHYFPADSVRPEYLGASDTHSRCFWKGTARYYDLKVGDRVNRDAAWYYPDPSPAAAEIKDRIAFWRGVKGREGRRAGTGRGYTRRRVLQPTSRVPAAPRPSRTGPAPHRGVADRSSRR
jgi:uncharacterized protein (DUF427 family)